MSTKDKVSKQCVKLQNGAVLSDYVRETNTVSIVCKGNSNWVLHRKVRQAMIEDSKTYTGDELLDMPEQEVVYSKAIQGTLAVVSMLDIPDNMEIQVSETPRFIIITSFVDGRRLRNLRLKSKYILKQRPVDLYETFERRLFPKKHNQLKE